MKTKPKKTIAIKKKKPSLNSNKKAKSLTSKQEGYYLKRREIAHEMGNLERRVKELKEDRQKLDGKLAPIFNQSDNRVRLSDGTIVVRKIVDIDERVATKVGQLIQSGFSYPRYSEVNS